LLHLTDFGKEMREYSKGVVLRFDEAVKETVPEEDLEKFIEVANTIMDLIGNKKIYNQETNIKQT
jgi:MarR family transcriptional regulator, organic hydroperoxide resistance regulator